MRPNYTDLPSQLYGIGKRQTYEHKGALRNIDLSLPPSPLVPQPQHLVTLRSEMDSTS